MKIGILALQGGFAKHIDVLNQLEVESIEVRLPDQLGDIDALILPGGESTTNIKLIQTYHMFDPISNFAKTKPLFGTCAGSILMGTRVTNFDFPSFQLIDATVHRNAYGTQVDSFMDSIEFQGQNVDVMFIRAPKFSDLGNDVEILSEHNNDPIVVRNQHHLMATCHPELTGATEIHEYFLNEIVRM
jgi:5'-phosphate synthase pdxT subunit